MFCEHIVNGPVSVTVLFLQLFYADTAFFCGTLIDIIDKPSVQCKQKAVIAIQDQSMLQLFKFFFILIIL